MNIEKGLFGQNNQKEVKGITTSLLDEVLKRRREGVEVFNALLKDRGQDAVDKKKNELWDHPSGSDRKKIEGLNTSKENLQDFSSDAERAKNASLEELENIYSYGYGDQNSSKYLGKLLVAIEGFAFAQGFTSAYLDAKNGTKSDINIIDEELKSYIELANKMTEVGKRK